MKLLCAQVAKDLLGDGIDVSYTLPSFKVRTYNVVKMSVKFTLLHKVIVFLFTFL